jgi:hypothetical protein
MSRELEVLREEYWKARANLSDPVLLDLIIERIELLENKESE